MSIEPLFFTNNHRNNGFSILKVVISKQSAQQPLVKTREHVVHGADNPNLKHGVHLILTPDVTLIFKARIHLISVADENQYWRCVTCRC